jgi:hypothetical protein
VAEKNKSGDGRRRGGIQSACRRMRRVGLKPSLHHSAAVIPFCASLPPPPSLLTLAPPTDPYDLYAAQIALGLR